MNKTASSNITPYKLHGQHMNSKTMLNDRSQKVMYCYDLIYTKIHKRQIQRDRGKEWVPRAGEKSEGQWLLMGTRSPSGMMEYFGIRVNITPWMY